MLEVQNEILKRLNAIQILVEALSDELIEKKLISEQSMIKRIDAIRREIDEEFEDETNSILYFGPKGEA